VCWAVKIQQPKDDCQSKGSKMTKKGSIFITT